MAAPRVFVSSTCYDLKYIRENMKYFIRTVGYEPILSEDGNVFYDPQLHVQDACLREVPNCQLFVLIIGGRYGSEIRGGATSVTNAEYREAVRLHIPVFALVEQTVYNDNRVWLENRGNPNIDANRIAYPSVDSTRIFEFIEEVKSHSVNNALVPFRDFHDIESYLRQQWAGMMFSFLASANESSRVADTLEILRGMNERVEMLSRQILQSVGTDTAKLTTRLYDAMLSYEAVRDLSFIGAHPTPATVLQNETFADCAKALGRKLKVDKSKDHSISSDGEISQGRLDADSRRYLELRSEMLGILAEHKITVAEFLQESAKEPSVI